MNKGKMIKVADHMEILCKECQLYAVKYFIWNAESEQLEAVLQQALETLPGKVSTEGWHKSLKTVLDSQWHCFLRDILKQTELSLLSPCKTEECEKSCEQFWSKR